jgi:hypothetical protein
MLAVHGRRWRAEKADNRDIETLRQVAFRQSKSRVSLYTPHPRWTSAAHYLSENATSENPSPRVRKRSPVSPAGLLRSD